MEGLALSPEASRTGWILEFIDFPETMISENEDSEVESECSDSSTGLNIIPERIANLDELKISKRLSHNQLSFARWLRSLHDVDNENVLLEINESRLDYLIQTNINILFNSVDKNPSLKVKILECVAPLFCKFHQLSNYFWLLPPDCVEDILKHPLLDIESMDDILKTLFQWGEVNYQKQYLPALLSHLDLQYMSSSYLVGNETVHTEWLDGRPIQIKRYSAHSWLFVEMDYQLMLHKNLKLDEKKENDSQKLLEFYYEKESRNATMFGHCIGNKQVWRVEDVPVVLTDKVITIADSRYIYFIEAGLGQVIKYDPAKNSVSSEGNLAYPVIHAVAVLQNGVIYIVGKRLKSKINYRLQSYNPTSGKSEELASTYFCCQQAHLFIKNDEVHIVGSSKAFPLVVERYNRSSNIWIVIITTFPFNSPWHHAAVCNNKVYLNSTSAATKENLWLVYDFVSKSWAEHPFHGGPISVTGMWTTGNSENTELLVQDEQHLFYTYKVTSKQWTIVLQCASAARRGCRPEHQTLYRGPIMAETQKQDLRTPEVTIVCDDFEFNTNRLLHSKTSSYFSTILSSGFEAVKNGVITFERILEFEHLLETLRKEMLDAKDFVDVVEATNFSTHCFDKLVENVSLHNFEEMITAASLYNNHGFMARILTYLARNLHRVTLNDEHLKVDEGLMKMILHHPELDTRFLGGNIALPILNLMTDHGHNSGCGFGYMSSVSEPMCSFCDQIFITQYETQSNILRKMKRENLLTARLNHQKLHGVPFYNHYYILFYGACRRQSHTGTDQTKCFYDDVTSEWIVDKNSFLKLDPNSPLADAFETGYQKISVRLRHDRISMLNKQISVRVGHRRTCIRNCISLTSTNSSRFDKKPEANQEFGSEVPISNGRGPDFPSDCFSLPHVSVRHTDNEHIGNHEISSKSRTSHQQVLDTTSDHILLISAAASCSDKEQTGGGKTATKITLCHQEYLDAISVLLHSVALQASMGQASYQDAVSQFPTCQKQYQEDIFDRLLLALYQASCADKVQAEQETSMDIPKWLFNDQLSLPDTEALQSKMMVAGGQETLCKSASQLQPDNGSSLLKDKEKKAGKQVISIAIPGWLFNDKLSLQDAEELPTIKMLAGGQETIRESTTQLLSDDGLHFSSLPDDDIKQAGEQETPIVIPRWLFNDQFALRDAEALQTNMKLAEGQETINEAASQLLLDDGLHSSSLPYDENDKERAEEQEVSIDIPRWLFNDQFSLQDAEALQTNTKLADRQETICESPSQLSSDYGLHSSSFSDYDKLQICQHKYFYVFQSNDQNITKGIIRWCFCCHKIISFTRLHSPVCLLGAEGLHGLVYIAGTIGNDESIILQRYCPLTDKCERLKPPGGLFKCKFSLSKSIFVSENYLYLIGRIGYHDSGYHLWRYNPVTSQWTVVIRQPDECVFQKIIHPWDN